MIEQSIFANLLNNESYYRTVIPHIKKEYFSEQSHQRLFSYIKFFSDKYNKRPDTNVLGILLNKDTSLDDGTFESIKLDLKEISEHPQDLAQTQFLIDETENFCKQRAVYNALKQSIEIKENADLSPDRRNKKLKDVGAIPELLRDALSICFDSSVGHNYLNDWEKRFDSYHDKQSKIPFDLDILNKITKGGVELKTLNMLIAGSNVGKSMGLVHLAASYVSQGFDVLYISMEMSEEAVSKRVDANLLGISLDDLENIPKALYKNKIDSLKNKIVGQLFVKQFPTGAAHVGHFRALLSELAIKQSFKPKIIIVDYLGICASVRIGFGGENSYGYVKAISEELRGLAIETDTCVWSAAQTTRGQWDKSDMDMSDVAESAGLVHTSDFMLGLVETDELAQSGQQMIKQIKSRYGDKSKNSKFFIGVDKSRQLWSQLESGGSYNNAPTQTATPSVSISPTKELDSSDVDW